MSLVISHPYYQRVLKLLDTTIGREKLMRTVQYWSRFLAFYLYQKGYSRETYMFWKNLQNQIKFCRQMFRVGKPLSHFKLAVAAYANQTADPVLRLSSVGRQLGYLGYMGLDTVMWIHSAKVKNFNSMPTIQKTAQRFWLFGLCCNLVNSLRRFQQAKVRQAALEVESEKDVESIKKVEQEQCAATKQFVWDLLDTSIPLSGLGIVKLDDGVVGLCGLVTSILGLKSVW